ncbi:solute carrier family 2, facilitated glucose transporter member 8 [Strongylocentrotus purpuratus]|uniref:Major facilitator superfamily (MFS) profile domain-containing protein n=1 Tax=Strongylocentrotus purpuratus TaxID=7668 RepID=A0A7M7RH29_STRPU|nr:solute carrier family 2, facilitated glucose transporter member 8 [Strongylocentrotus purpuratus]
MEAPSENMDSKEVPQVQIRDTESLIPRDDDGERKPSVTSTKGQNASLYFIVALVLQAPLVTGFAIGYSSPALPKIAFPTSDEESWFGSLLNIGAMVGGPVAGFLLQCGGRKLTIMATGIPFITGWVLIGTASNEHVINLYCGRILTGMGCGMACLAVPNYIAEVAPPNLRGFLGSSFQVAVTIGILLVYCLGIPITYSWLALTGAALTALLVVTVVMVPETPRYLLMKRLKNQAMLVLRRLRGPMVDVEFECREIEDALGASDDKFRWSEFSRPYLYKPLLISLVLMFVQQFSGINAVMFYTVSIFESAAPSLDPNVATVIVGAVQVAFTCVAAVLMDKVGRKALLITGAIGLAVSSATFGLYYQVTGDDVEKQHKLSAMSLVSIIVYIISFSLAWGPIPWLIMSEIFPSKARGVASGIATAFNWGCAFIVTKEFAHMQETLTKQGIFWFYGGICLLGAIFVFFFVPETKGRSLEEIEASFAGNERRSR